MPSRTLPEDAEWPVARRAGAWRGDLGRRINVEPRVCWWQTSRRHRDAFPERQGSGRGCGLCLTQHPAQPRKTAGAAMGRAGSEERSPPARGPAARRGQPLSSARARQGPPNWSPNQGALAASHMPARVVLEQRCPPLLKTLPCVPSCSWNHVPFPLCGPRSHRSCSATSCP